MQIGFIGVGNMARAIIDGLLKAGTVQGSDLHLHSGHIEHYGDYAKSIGATVENDNKAVVENSDVVVLAVKPNIYDRVLDVIKPAFAQKQVLLASIVSGVSLAELGQHVPAGQAIVRLLPNLNVEIGAGMTAYALNDEASDCAEPALKLFASIGELMELPEADFATFVALAGSAPAFAYLFIDAMARAGVKHGLSKPDAVRIAAQTVNGSAQMVLKSASSPMDLIDKVASPGGSTIRGYLTMEDKGFSPAVVAGLDATIARELGED
ncbi:pyrroline-5-carboxylate reductase [Lacticaseibacillus songhuajiangensis]|jgi:pyrroline-5-carboxylate reductase|uniref:pyrroline-5-carboxylate reductase n=1 Tax=Lacticaseibacillus songhuajiangensis TaxID=1296539 RepID=UPI000F796B91|nr:pyrroline-5-carboxylate reductase [Lacticaseibacillus songhuajiangensis]MCI1283371.1 pyrroline-5-carboxylate reductase [Lacticaseibacillus songhuajiangensis]